MLVATVPIAAEGWLYLLRRAGVLELGPSLSGALPLEQLAGADAQPLVRMVAAWAPAGAVAAAVLAWLVPYRRAARAAIVTAGFALVLVAAGAASDAVATSEGIVGHVAAQPARPGTWAAVGIAALGSLLPPDRRPRRGRPRTSAG